MITSFSQEQESSRKVHKQIAGLLRDLLTVFGSFRHQQVLRLAADAAFSPDATNRKKEEIHTHTHTQTHIPELLYVDVLQPVRKSFRNFEQSVCLPIFGQRFSQCVCVRRQGHRRGMVWVGICVCVVSVPGEGVETKVVYESICSRWSSSFLSQMFMFGSGRIHVSNRAPNVQSKTYSRSQLLVQ